MWAVLSLTWPFPRQHLFALSQGFSHVLLQKGSLVQRWWKECEIWEGFVFEKMVLMELKLHFKINVTFCLCSLGRGALKKVKWSKDAKRKICVLVLLWYNRLMVDFHVFFLSFHYFVEFLGPYIITITIQAGICVRMFHIRKWEMISTSLCKI